VVFICLFPLLLVSRTSSQPWPSSSGEIRYTLQSPSLTPTSIVVSQPSPRATVETVFSTQQYVSLFNSLFLSVFVCMIVCYVWIFVRVCMVTCHSDMDPLVRSGLDLNSCSPWTQCTGNSKTDPWDNSEIHTGSCSEDQTMIWTRNCVISCKCTRSPSLWLVYFIEIIFELLILDIVFHYHRYCLEILLNSLPDYTDNSYVSGIISLSSYIVLCFMFCISLLYMHATNLYWHVC